MSLLLPDTGLLFWMLVSFGIVLFVLIRYGFPPIVKGIEKRREYIDGSLQAAREAEEKVAALNREAAGILDKARKEQGKILQQAEKAGAGIVERARLEAETLARGRFERAEAEAEELKRKAMKEVADQIAGLSIKIAGKVIEEDLGRDERQRKLIDRLLGEELPES